MEIFNSVGYLAPMLKASINCEERRSGKLCAADIANLTSDRHRIDVGISRHLFSTDTL